MSRFILIELFNSEFGLDASKSDSAATQDVTERIHLYLAFDIRLRNLLSRHNFLQRDKMFS